MADAILVTRVWKHNFVDELIYVHRDLTPQGPSCCEGTVNDYIYMQGIL